MTQRGNVPPSRATHKYSSTCFFPVPSTTGTTPISSRPLSPARTCKKQPPIFKPNAPPSRPLVIPIPASSLVFPSSKSGPDDEINTGIESMMAFLRSRQIMLSVDAKDEIKRIFQNFLVSEPINKARSIASPIFAEKKSLPLPVSTRNQSVVTFRGVLPGPLLSPHDGPGKMRSILEAYKSQILLQANLISTLKTRLPVPVHLATEGNEEDQSGFDKSEIKSRNAFSTRRNSLEDKEAIKSVDGIAPRLSDDGVGIGKNKRHPPKEDGKILGSLTEKDEHCYAGSSRSELMHAVKGRIAEIIDGQSAKFEALLGQKAENIQERVKRMKKYVELQTEIQKELRKSAAGYRRQSERLMQDIKFAERARGELQKKVRDMEGKLKALQIEVSSKDELLRNSGEKEGTMQKLEEERGLLATQLAKRELEWKEEKERILGEIAVVCKCNHEKDARIAKYELATKHWESEKARLADEFGETKAKLMEEASAVLERLRKAERIVEQQAKALASGKQSYVQEKTLIIEAAGKENERMAEEFRQKIAALSKQHKEEMTELEDTAKLRSESEKSRLTQAFDKEKTRLVNLLQEADRKRWAEEKARTIKERDQLAEKQRADERAELIQDLSEKSDAETARLIHEHNNTVAALKSQLKAELEQKTSAMAEQYQEGLLKQRKAVTAEFERKIQELNTRVEAGKKEQAFAWDNEKTKITQEHDSEKELLKKDFKQKVEALIQDCDVKMGELQRRHELEKATWNSETEAKLRAVVLKSKEEIDADRNKHETEMRCLKEHMAVGWDEERRGNNEKELRIKALIEDHDAKMGELKGNHEMDKARWGIETEKRMQEAKTGFAAENRLLVEKYESEMKLLREEMAKYWDEEKKKLIEEYAQRAKALDQKAAEEKEVLMEKYNSLASESENSAKQAAEEKDRITQEFSREKAQLLDIHTRNTEALLKQHKEEMERLTAEMRTSWNSEKTEILEAHRKELASFQLQSAADNAGRAQEFARRLEAQSLRHEKDRACWDSERKALEESYEAKSAACNSEKKKIMEEHTHSAEVLAELSALYETEKKAHVAETAQLIEKHGKELESLSSKHEFMLKTERESSVKLWADERAALVRELTTKHEQEIKKLLQDAADKRESEAKIWESEKVRMAAEFLKERSSLERDLHKAQQWEVKTKEALISAHAQSLESMERQHAADKAKWQQDTMDRSTKIETEWREERTRLVEEQNARIESLVQQHNEEKARLACEHEAEKLVVIEESKRDKEAAEKLRATELADQKRLIETLKQDREVSWEAEKTNMIQQHQTLLEHELSEAKETLQHSHEADKQQLVNEHARTLETLKEQHRKDKASWETEKVRNQALLEHKLSETRKSLQDLHKADKLQLVNEHTRTLETLKEQHRKDKASWETEKAGVIQANQSLLELKLSESRIQLISEHSKTLEVLKEQHRKDKASWEADIFKQSQSLLEVKLAEEKAGLTVEHSKALEALKQQHSVDTASWETEKSSMFMKQKELAETQYSLQRSNEEEKSRLTREHSEEIEALRRRYGADKEIAITRQQQAFAESKESLQKSHEDEKARLIREHSQEIEELHQRFNADKASWEAERMTMIQQHKDALASLQHSCEEDKTGLIKEQEKAIHDLKQEHRAREAKEKQDSALEQARLTEDWLKEKQLIQQNMASLWAEEEKAKLLQEHKRSHDFQFSEPLALNCVPSKKPSSVLLKDHIRSLILSKVSTSISPYAALTSLVSRIQGAVSRCGQAMAKLKVAREKEVEDTDVKISALTAQTSRLNFQIIGLTSVGAKLQSDVAAYAHHFNVLRYKNSIQTTVLAETFCPDNPAKFLEEPALLQTLESEIEMSKLAVVQALESEGIEVANKGSLLGLLQKLTQTLQSGEKRMTMSAKSDSPNKTADGLKVRLGTTIINLEDMRKEKEYFKRRSVKMEKRAKDCEATVKALMQRLDQSKEEQKGQELRVSEMAYQFQEIKEMLENARETLRAGLKGYGAKIPQKDDISVLCNVAISMLGSNADSSLVGQ